MEDAHHAIKPYDGSREREKGIQDDEMDRIVGPYLLAWFPTRRVREAFIVPREIAG